MKKKVILIGLDAAIPTLVQRFFKLNKLPNMKRLADEGTRSELIPVFPTHTASNWNSVSTGASPQNHGVTDMVIHFPGTPLTEIKSGFYSNFCKAEQIWKTAELHGKKTILMKYIASWPPNSQNVIQVEGFGAPGGPGSRPWGSSPQTLANSSCYCTDSLQNANRIYFASANLSEWTGILEKYMKIKPLESKITIGTSYKLTYHILTISESGTKYDTVIISKNKNFNNALKLNEGQLSAWIFDEFTNADTKIEASFRMKLIELKGGETSFNFKLYVTQVFPRHGWTYPAELSEKLVNKFGPFLESISHFPYAFGWVDESTYLEDAAYQADWMAKVSQYLMSKNNWDLYMTQWHGIDNTQHAFLRFDKTVLTKDESEMGDMVVQKTYEIADKFVGDITRSYKNSNEEIYTLVVSDHGHVMGKRRFFLNSYLLRKGLIKLKKDEKSGKISIDWKYTKVFFQGMVHIYVNLEGRDPEGCVKNTEEYNHLVNQIIDLLYEVKDPITGLRPIVLALSNNDAKCIGISGERCGDVIIAAHPTYALDNRIKIEEDLFEDLKTGLKDGSIHGAQLPAVDLGEYGTIKSMLIAHGPKIKKGYVIDKPISILNIAPTISYLLDMPSPKHSEGTVIRELFE
jgi:predicted AlkP superfamily phosphohydrolase/phosphomutase